MRRFGSWRFPVPPVAASDQRPRVALERGREGADRPRRGGDLFEGGLELEADGRLRAEDVVEALERGLVDSDSLRFFVGYSGWGEFQLNAELSEESWYMAHATAELVFAGDLKNQWRDAFRTLGPDYAVLANFPDDCMLN